MLRKLNMNFLELTQAILNSHSKASLILQIRTFFPFVLPYVIVVVKYLKSNEEMLEVSYYLVGNT